MITKRGGMTIQYAWHKHPDELLSLMVEPWGTHTALIRERTPQDAADLHLYLFHPVLGDLPPSVIRAGRALIRAAEAFFEAGLAYQEAKEAYQEAEAVHDRALQENMEQIEALHTQECSGCPWNGASIFSERSKT